MAIRKILVTLNSFPEGHKVKELFDKYIENNFKEYATKHNFEFIAIRENIAHPLHVHWSKLIWIREKFKELQYEDVITFIDSDCVILNMDIDFVFEKDLALAVESTGLMSTGFFSIKKTDWSIEFINKMLSTQPLCNECFNDNHALYLAMGLEMGHSFLETEHLQLLPTKFNVTIIPDELIETNEIDKKLKIYYRPDLFVSRQDAIIRHFSAGQIYKSIVLDYLK